MMVSSAIVLVPKLMTLSIGSESCLRIESGGESLSVRRLRDSKLARALELRLDYGAATGEVVKAEEIA